MSEIWKVESMASRVNALIYDEPWENGIHISVTFPKNNPDREMDARRTFWKEFERLKKNQKITK